MNIDTSWFKSKKSTHKNSWISRLENHKLSSPKKAWENNAKRQTLPTLFVTFPTDAHLGEANSRWQGMLYRCEDSKEATTRGTAGIQTQIIYLSSIYVHVYHVYMYIHGLQAYYVYHLDFLYSCSTWNCISNNHVIFMSLLEGGPRPWIRQKVLNLTTIGVHLSNTQFRARHICQWSPSLPW